MGKNKNSITGKTRKLGFWMSEKMLDSEDAAIFTTQGYADYGKLNAFDERQEMVVHRDGIAIVFADNLKYNIDVPLNPFFKGHQALEYASQFSHEKTVKCQILEVFEDKVLAKVLLNEKKQLFQKRKFDKAPLEGIINLKEGEAFTIKILTKPGERRFLYKKIEGESLFRPIKERKFFSDFANHPIFKPLPKDKDVDHNV